MNAAACGPPPVDVHGRLKRGVTEGNTWGKLGMLKTSTNESELQPEHEYTV